MFYFLIFCCSTKDLYIFSLLSFIVVVSLNATWTGAWRRSSTSPDRQWAISASFTCTKARRNQKVGGFFGYAVLDIFAGVKYITGKV